jgi:hypothetical protein
MTEYFRLPDQLDYKAAVEMQADIIERNGGAWVYAQRLDEHARQSPKTWLQYGRTAMLTYLIEPTNQYEADEYDPSTDSFKRKYRATHAFKHGLLNGYEVVTLAHDTLIDYMGILSYLTLTMEKNLGEEASEHDKAELLRELGERGLDRAGEGAQTVVEQLAADFSSNVDHQRLYTLGSGATFYAGFKIHDTYIDSVMQSEVQSLDWLEFFSASDTGE